METTIEKIAKLSGNKKVLASTQYGMRYILTTDNEIVHRDDTLTWSQVQNIAEEVNQRRQRLVDTVTLLRYK
jgi:predicted Zn-dependent protease